MKQGETTGSRGAAALGYVGAMLIDRNDTHGEAMGQHEVMAMLWRMYLLRPTEAGLSMRDIRGADAMFMMLLMKISRIMATGMKRQHVEDIAGYAGLILGVMDAMEETGDQADEKKDPGE